MTILLGVSEYLRKEKMAHNQNLNKINLGGDYLKVSYISYILLFDLLLSFCLFYFDHFLLDLAYILLFILKNFFFFNLSILF